MIKEDYVSFETARFLEEKGFLENTPMVYTQNGCFIPNGVLEDTYQKLYPAPTLQMAMKWLREKYGLYINIYVTYKDCIPHYQWMIDVLKTKETIAETPSCDKPEDACEVAMKYCLERLI